MQNTTFEHPFDLDIENPLAVKVRKLITKAFNDYDMIQANDRLMVCVSGGKDSTILSLLLKEIQKRSPIPFTFKAVLLDQKQPGFDGQQFKDFMSHHQIDFEIIEADTYSIVKEKIPEGNTYCSLCSRLRRGVLYNYAYEHRYNKMLMGHHRDDLLETLLMNLFYSGKLSSMPAKLKSDDGRNIVLRPMVYVAEKDLIDLRDQWNFPVIPCKLCGSQEGAKREKMTKLLDMLEKETPDLRSNMLHALTNVEPTQLLDKKLADFNF